MNRRYLAVAAALSALAGSANAAAWIDGSFAGMSYAINDTGGGDGYQYIYFGKDLAQGDSYSETFTYDLTIHNDGDQFPFGVDRSWKSECSPFGNFAPQCSPNFTTYELAEFDFAFDVSQYGAQGIDYEFTGWPAGDTISAAPGQTIRLQGSFTVTERNTLDNPMTPDPFNWLNTLEIHTAAWVDSTTATMVPEASVAMQLLIGLGVLATARRRRPNSRS